MKNRNNNTIIIFPLILIKQAFTVNILKSKDFPRLLPFIIRKSFHISIENI